MKKENKKTGLKIFIAIIIGAVLFMGGLFVGTQLTNQKESEKTETKEPIEEGVFNYKINDPIQTLQDVVNQNNKKAGEYTVEYKYTTMNNEEKTYSIKFDWTDKLVDNHKLNILINGKTIEHQCKNMCYNSIEFHVKPDHKYVIAYEKSDYMPLGTITIYNFEGDKVKEFNNVFDGYYLCDDSLINKTRKNIDIKTNFQPFSKNDNFFMVEDINMETIDWNWFEAKGTIQSIDWDTLETEKISETNVCFSQQ